MKCRASPISNNHPTRPDPKEKKKQSGYVRLVTDCIPVLLLFVSSSPDPFLRVVRSEPSSYPIGFALVHLMCNEALLLTYYFTPSMYLLKLHPQSCDGHMLLYTGSHHHV